VRDDVPETGAADGQMKSVGSYLREVRESRGIQLEEASSVTRIGKNYLLAIEGETFDKLPNPAYIKGFLRIYASYLGLSGDEIVALYDKSQAFHQIKSSPDSGKDQPQRRQKLKITGSGRWLVPLFLLAIVIAVSYMVGEQETKTGKEPAPPVVPSPVATTLPVPVQVVRSTSMQKTEPAAALAETRKSGAVSPGERVQPAGIILRLKVNQDCRLNITIDNVVSQQYDLRAGDLIEWKGEKVFTLDIGNAGGIEAEFNGKPLKPFGETGKTAHVILKAEGS
jgi:cytoskeleton protein RodZ